MVEVKEENLWRFLSSDGAFACFIWLGIDNLIKELIGYQIEEEPHFTVKIYLHRICINAKCVSFTRIFQEKFPFLEWNEHNFDKKSKWLFR